MVAFDGDEAVAVQGVGPLDPDLALAVGEGLVEHEAARLQHWVDPPAPPVISTQVIGEFYVVVTRELAKPLAVSDARTAVEQLLRLPVIPVDAELTRAAVATSDSAQLSSWDALIVEAASAGGCDLLLTEDLADGRSSAQFTHPEPIRPRSCPTGRRADGQRS